MIDIFGLVQNETNINPQAPNRQIKQKLPRIVGIV